MISVFFLDIVLCASNAERENVLILNDVAKKARSYSDGWFLPAFTHSLFKAFWQQQFKYFQATARAGSANDRECKNAKTFPSTSANQQNSACNSLRNQATTTLLKIQHRNTGQ